MNNYFRITGYDPKNDFSFIIDSNGMFEKLWQFSSYLIQKGLKVLEVSNSDQFLDINIEPIKEDIKHIILRATADGRPETIEQKIDGVTYKAVKVANKIYVSDNKIKL
jgi:hypothetical protein